MMHATEQVVDNVTFRDAQPDLGDSREEILAGLMTHPKTVNPKWFYDERGSQLFEAITQLPEYYPTRTERGILSHHRDAIGECCGSDCVLIEPGSGSSEKVRILLDALRPAAYVPVDISADFLREAARRLGQEYPWLPVHAVCADFGSDWSFLDSLPAGRRVVFYPGSTIGNLEPRVAADFLSRLRAMVGDDGGVLLGVDTHKSSDRLNAAYNDAAGVTADFNLNLLRCLNRQLDAEFSESDFRHHAFYNEDLRRIEMHLVSERSQQVRVNGSTVSFESGESIHTENSYKYTADDLARLAARAGMRVAQSWFDDEALFGVHFLVAA